MVPLPRTISLITLATLIQIDLAVAQGSHPTTPRNYSQEILNSRDSVMRAAGLTPLASTRIPEGTQEVRLWIGEGLGIPENLFQIVRRDGRVTGQSILFWDLGPSGLREPGQIDFHMLMLYTLAGQCDSVGAAGESRACHARLTAQPNWRSILDSMESHQLWTLPDESELPEDSIVVFDGWGMLVEVRDGAAYRAYHYGNPDAHKHQASREAVEIARAVHSVNTLLAPGVNWKRYRGLILTGARRQEFIPCGETEPWKADGGVAYDGWTPERADTVAHPLTRRYIEALGMKQLPGLALIHTDSAYADGIYIDSVYVNRPWDPKECETFPSGRE